MKFAVPQNLKNVLIFGIIIIESEEKWREKLQIFRCRLCANDAPS